MLNDNIDGFFNLRHFAVKVEYISKDNDSIETNIIFDSPYSSINFGSHIEGNEDKPQALGKTSVFNTAKNGERLIIDCKTYYIFKLYNNGDGTTTMLLSEKWNACINN